MSLPHEILTDALTVGQAAEILGVSSWTLRNWDKAGRLKPLRDPENGYRVYRRSQLKALMNSENHPGKPGDRLAPTVEWCDLYAAEHCVQFYENDAFLMDAVAAYIAPALTTHDGSFLICTESHRKGIEARLCARGLDISSTELQPYYRAFDAGQTLSRIMLDDSPNPELIRQVIGPTLEHLTQNGKCPRVFGEMVALLWAQGCRDQAIQLEALWNDLRKTTRFSLLCGYPLNSFSHDQDAHHFHEVCASHSHTLPAEGYAALPTAQQRLHEISTLQLKAAALEFEIAQRKSAEKSLSDREVELADFLENAVEGLHQVGPDGIILWTNKAELDLLGYARDEYVGRHISEFHADPEVIADMLQRLARGETLRNFPARLRRKDGDIKHVLIHSNAKLHEGRLLYTRCFTRDITDQHRAEARLAAIVESSDDAIVSKTLDGTIRSWNKGAQRLFGYTEQEVLGRSITVIIPPERLDEEKFILSCLAQGRHVEHYETVRLRKDGQPVEVSISVAPLRDAFGRIVGASKIARDISDRRLVESELRRAKAIAEQANNAKDRFLAMLSHELRTPLNPVLLSVAAMETDPTFPNEWRQEIAMIRRNLELETRLIDDLLDVSRVISGKMALHKEHIQLHPLVSKVLDMVRQDAEQKQLHLRLDLAASSDHLYADAARLQQVLWNLLKNAVKFTPEGGGVTLRTRNHFPQRLIIEIEDTGIGIDPCFFATIFRPFEQGDRSMNGAYGGLGLGLAISKAVVDLHEGTINVHSEGKGRGTRFIVNLPSLQIKAASAQLNPAAATVPSK